MDVDIDFKTTFDPLDYFDEAIRASMVNKDAQLIKHPAGVYFQSIPQDSTFCPKAREDHTLIPTKLLYDIPPGLENILKRSRLLGGV